MPRPRAYWIRLDDGVHDHPKVVQLALNFNVSRETIVGHLTRLWLWVRKYRPTGFLGGLTDEMLAEAAGWKGDPREWRERLGATRLTTHERHGERLKGWIERNGYQVRETKRNRDKTPLNRERKPRESRTYPAPQDGQDVQYKQEDRKTVSDPPRAADSDAGPRAPRTRTKPRPRNGHAPERMAELADLFERFYSDYPRHEGKQAAWKAFVKLDPNRETLKAIVLDMQERIDAGRWEPDNPERVQFIPLPATYLNGRRWEDRNA